MNPCGNPRCRVCLAEADADFIVDVAGEATDTRPAPNVVGEDFPSLDVRRWKPKDIYYEPAWIAIDEPKVTSPAQLESERRKATPIFSGVLRYFPDALAAVARLSKAGNDKHNPGQPLHWSRGKSTDHGDCITRHQITFDEVDNETGEYHATAVAWRALAQLQLLEEAKLKRDAEPLSGPQEPVNDWIKWVPDMMIRPAGRVDVKLRAGMVFEAVPANKLLWGEQGAGSIVAYRYPSAP